jgi:hypothetical protein
MVAPQANEKTTPAMKLAWQGISRVRQKKSGSRPINYMDRDQFYPGWARVMETGLNQKVKNS